jgi:HPt (histidine-containing phosphotransfer) domain-containing protein
MNKDNQLLDYTQIDQISGGDINFKKELIEIFIGQISEFISNMNQFFSKNEWELLAREAHTAKSSALIFGMTETGSLLKQIQTLAENNELTQLESLVKKVITDLNAATILLNETLENI